MQKTANSNTAKLERIVIRETDAGYVVNGEVVQSLRKAVEIAGPRYTLIPAPRT